MGITTEHVRAYGKEMQQAGGEEEAAEGAGPAAETTPEAPDESQEAAVTDEGQDGATAAGIGEGDAEDKGEGGVEDKGEGGGLPKRAKKRIDDLTREKHDADRTASYWRKVASNEQPSRAEAAAAGQPYREIKAPEGEGEPGQGAAGEGGGGEYDGADPADPQPQRAAFEDEDGELEEDKYLDARMDWRERQRERVAARKQQSEAREQAQASAAERWNEHRNSSREKYPDFDEVVSRDDVQVSQAMGIAIIGSEIGGEIAYHLGKHPEEAERINALGRDAQLQEMGKLEARIEAQLAAAAAGDDADGAGENNDPPKDPAAADAGKKPAKRETSAPPAPTPTGGGGNEGRSKPRAGTEEAVMAQRTALRKGR